MGLGRRRRVTLERRQGDKREVGLEEAAPGGRGSGLASGARRPPHLDSGDSKRTAQTCPAGPGARGGGGAGLGLHWVCVSLLCPERPGAAGSHCLVSLSLGPLASSAFLLSASTCTHFNLRITN